MKHKEYKFKGRHYSVRSCISLAMGILSVGAYLGMTIFSGLNGGNAGFFVGIVGVICFAVSTAGVILAVQSMKERDIYYGISISGIVLNGLALIAYLVSYIIGATSYAA